MTDFLLELRCEEIPARMQLKASEDLARLFTEELAKSGLKPARITSYVTPRRLALIAHDLPAETAAVSEEFKGPRTSAPAQALEGFLRKTGLTQDQLQDRDGVWFALVEKPGRKTADVLAEAVPAVIRAFPWPKSMRWGNASTTTESLRWVRPLQGIVAILGEDLVPIEVEGIVAGFATVGHRFHHSGEITIGGAHDYAEKLRACHVVVDHAERQAIIAEKATALAAARGYSLIEDKGLVVENAGLTEWPVPLLGDFDPAFLEVPPEVIQLTLRINQKYFVLRDGEGKLAPAFICTANIEAKDGGTAIVAGNGKVLAARLSDAQHFWEEDQWYHEGLGVSRTRRRRKRLLDHSVKLSRIKFHEKLGTVDQRAARIGKLSRLLIDQGIVGGSAHTSAALKLRRELADLAEESSHLAKADLATEMVSEFPELQGVIGGYYARAEGLSPIVADAIRDHYKPVGQSDDIPSAPVTVAVSIADKLDTLVSFFSVELKPSGSRDPFALRRAGLAIIALAKTLPSFSVANVVETAWEALARQYSVQRRPAVVRFMEDGPTLLRIGDFFLDDGFDSDRTGESIFFIEENNPGFSAISLGIRDHGEFLDYLKREYLFVVSRESVVSDIIDFLVDRLKVQQREAGVRHDLIDAVFALGGEDDLVRLLARVKALQSFVSTEDGANLLAGYKRAANILKKEEAPAAHRSDAGEEDPGAAVTDPDVAAAIREHDANVAAYTPEPAEAALTAALDSAEPAVDAAIAAEDFAGAMSALASLRAPIDAFFEHVTVNDPDRDKRTSRLTQLTRVRAAMHKVADFSKIEG